MKITKTFKSFIFGIVGFGVLIAGWLALSASVFAQGVTMSPMNQKVVAAPGDSYSSSFVISNPGTNTDPFNYSLEIKSFYVDENYNTIFDEPASYNEITEWITLDVPLSGTIAPNQYAEINFTVNVPEDAPAGGQYAAIVATVEDTSAGAGMSISEHQAVAQIIFAEITGETVKQGEILDATLPGFLLQGNITASSTIKNTGNVHGTATYTLKITPIFGGAAVFDNTDAPETHIIVPDRTLYSETTWTGTPAIGMFNAVYTVEFEGVKTEVSKLIIICPVWLMFLIVLAVAALIIWLVVRSVGHKRVGF